MAEFSSETVEARDIGVPFKELKKFRKKKINEEFYIQQNHS